MAGFWWAIAVGITLLIVQIRCATAVEECPKDQVWYKNKVWGNTQTMLSYLKSHSDPTVHYEPVFHGPDIVLVQDVITWFYVPALDQLPYITPLKSCDDVGTMIWYRNREECPFKPNDKSNCECVDAPNDANLMRIGVKQSQQMKCTLYLQLGILDDSGIYPITIRSYPEDTQAALKHAQNLTIDHSHVWTTTTTTTPAHTTTTTTVPTTVGITTESSVAPVADAFVFGTASETGGISVTILVLCFGGALLFGGCIIVTITVADFILSRRAQSSSTSSTDSKGVPFLSATGLSRSTVSKQSGDSKEKASKEKPKTGSLDSVKAKTDDGEYQILP